MQKDTRLRGAALGLAAAALFGLSAPLAKLLLPSMSPLTLASLLYLGGGGGLALYALARRWRGRARPLEASLTRRDLPLLAGVVLCGGVIGPWLMLVGLARLSALSTSLLLNLEGPFTVLLAVALFKEHLGRSALAGVALVFLGSALVGVAGGELRADPLGVAAVAGACLSWAVDNNLTQRLSLRDPVAIVRWKGLAAGTLTLGLAIATGQPLPAAAVVLPALLLGVFSYGLSIVLDLYALRILGAARQAAFFATAPFLGALAAVPLLGERPSVTDLLGGAAIAAGVLALLRERHSHLHTHQPLEHSHLHVHDAHHQHEHDGPWTEPHAHPHRHAALTHDHPHVSDLHHRHRHRD